MNATIQCRSIWKLVFLENETVKNIEIIWIFNLILIITFPSVYITDISLTVSIAIECNVAFQNFVLST